MSRKFDHLADVEVFMTVMEHGSLTAGAVALSTTPSVASRAISRLEAKLGTQLLRRTTRQLSLTDAGRMYLEQARIALSTIDEVERAIQGQDGELTGLVRISAPTTYGHYRLPAKLRRFRERYPNVKVELHIANRNVDLVAEGFDMAIRVGRQPDSGLVARQLEDAPKCVVAAPAYLARAGQPTSLQALERHTCLSFLMPSTGRPNPWTFRSDGKDIEWLPPATITVSEDVLGVVSLAEQGLGLCQIYDFVVKECIDSGRLVEVLTELRGYANRFSLIYPPHRRLSAASRAMIEILTETSD
ncbi:LysR family transcriptional regulator [Chitinivorax sp. B]|uniref:LysR family transcriptional regulator n=1 Tax=Chitinivorax sp. B TaxID=2502235 RepID=UPI0010F5B87D|nr:LysR family transcriptional regulator [Chitinivorax sp. B]